MSPWRKAWHGVLSDEASDTAPGGNSKMSWRIVAEATYEESWMLQGPGTMLIVNGAPTNPVMYASEPETHTRRISLLAGASYRF